MRLTFLTRYGSLGASSRYRFYLYAELMRGSGHKINVCRFFSDSYLKRLYNGRIRNPLHIPGAFLRRIKDLLLRRGDNMVIEYELLPFMPYFIEKMFIGNSRYVLNFDDNVWEKYKGIPWLRGKYDRLIENAAGVIAANDFLLQKAAFLNKNSTLIPTVVNPELYKSTQAKFDKFTLIWIGTPVTYSYIEAHAETLRAMALQCDFELLIVARRSLRERAIEGVRMRFMDWSQEREGEAVARSHVGIMPLTDDEFSRGKSAFKIIQYQAAGLPVIASPVGANITVVEDGLSGFLAGTKVKWVEAVRRLQNERSLYSTMSAAALRASDNYSIQKYFPKFEVFLKSAFNNKN
ncbi:glycosyltransferase family 4 protein [Lentisphaerota bacterium ZTH]|nr:glycosyltransferase family 4 protein [Lentisphaerota bacterium]WET07161.1 glycosyltransferase family 4 protein [Lentisphaerota bacterium ZTH]